MNPPINRHRCIMAAVLLTFLAGNYCSFSQDLPTAKPEDVGVSSEKVAELSTFMQSLVDDGKIAGGVTMMARHGKVVHLEAVGMADRESNVPMRTDSIFRMASMTKPITTVALMMLWEEGKLDLDDPVSKFIPEFKNPAVLVTVDPLETRPAKREITIRHLLTHTSGIGYMVTDKIGPIYLRYRIPTGMCTTSTTLEQTMQTLGKLPILFDPGEQFLYGLSSDVLGRVVEVAADMPLDQFIDARICRPLGMLDTSFYVPRDKRSRMVSIYISTETGLCKLPEGKQSEFMKIPISSDYHLETNRFLSGGGGLCSTANDYMRFFRMLLSGGELDGVRLLKDETVKLMTVDQTRDLKQNFGFGFTVYPDEEGVHEQLKGAYAWFGFWTTSFRISPRGNWILIALSQVAREGISKPDWFEIYEAIAADAVLVAPDQ